MSGTLDLNSEPTPRLDRLTRLLAKLGEDN